MRRSLAIALLVVIVAPLLGCGGPDHNPVEPDGLPQAVPPPAAPTAPPPAPPAAPPATTAPADPGPAGRPVNVAPTVKLRYVGASGCHPSRRSGTVSPCFVDLEAVASDPDGDPLTFAWKGCASGGGRTASCLIGAPGTFNAGVDVSDGRGGAARDSLAVFGLNQPPSAVFNAPRPPVRAGVPVEIFGNVNDPDDGFVCGRSWCVGAQASGACGPNVFLECTCLEGLYAEVTPSSAGTCSVTVTLRDDWGLEGQAVLRFDVQP